MYTNGHGIKQDAKEADVVQTCRGLQRRSTTPGVKYHTGEGVNQDCKEAVAWYRKAAEKGFAQAQHNLGCL